MVHDFDSCPLYNNALIQNHLDDWMEFAAAEDNVGLFDSSSWGDCQDFTALKDLICSEISPIPCQQQRLNNYMQMAGRVAQTGVDNKHCT